MANPTPYFAIQPSFTGGEISKDVASRIDLQKYQSALLQAENAFIKPYGGTYKRPGTLYCGETKHSDKKAILVKFTFTTEICYKLEFGEKYARVWKNGVYINIELATPYMESDLRNLRFTQSADVIYICSGAHPVQIITRYSENNWTIKEIKLTASPYEPVNDDEGNYLTPSGTGGAITITATKDTFETNHVGGWIKFLQEISGTTVSCGGGASGAVRVGDAWKIITHGTWSGTVTIQYSEDGATWKQLRQFSSKNDFNATESGTVEEYSYMRVVVSLSSGSCTADLTAYPYTHEGHAKITGFINARQVNAVVVDALGNTAATIDWNMGSWNQAYGFPNCSAFFQDRLTFGGNKKNPHAIWMSRSGDYVNFGVEKASGNITDDSAIFVNLISRNLYKITHLMQSQDLVILTDGNEWIISGSETVTPTNITPKIQTARGCNDCEPQNVGNRIVFVQKRGATIRDMGYSYDSDNYTGIDLTLLAKHLINKKEVIDCTYSQEPDSMLFFVRDDGVVLCLTYIREQEVFAWSHIITDGAFESVLSVNLGNEDVVYAVIRRTINGEERRYIERFTLMSDSDDAQDYCMLDAAKQYESETATDILTGLEHLQGKEVKAVADGYLFESITVSDDGSITLPTPCNRAIVGLPYTMKIEQPNFNVDLRDGSMQGRQKSISSVTLRLENSRGGMVGGDFERMDDIIFEEGIDIGETALYTGDKKIDVPAGGFNEEGRVCIRHEEPYPFSLSAIIRVVSFGG